MVRDMSEATSPKPNLKNGAKPSSQKTGALIQQIGLNMLMVGLVTLLGFMVYQRLTGKQQSFTLGTTTDLPVTVETHQIATPISTDPPVALAPFSTPSTPVDGIVRKTDLKTIIPSRPRVEVITYTVQAGDTLFSIAANFSLKPETLLWGNYEVLNDNPHLLKPKQALNILPTNGVYYEWQEGDTLDSVAAFFKTDPQSIINYSGNFIDLTQAGENGSGIEPGTWMIIPGGKRAIKDWGPPAITRQNPASARYYGEGACGDIYEGAMGIGTFIWPTTDHTLPGNAFDSSVHPAIKALMPT
jgi:LysM repeat protein